jgi:hypothetical protein
MALFRRGDVWWYEFWFAGQRVRESTKSPSKTVAKEAEKNRKRELEEGFNNITDQRRERIRTFREMAEDFFDGYKIRLPDSATFAEYAVDHLKRLLGSKMLVDFSEAVVIKYQTIALPRRLLRRQSMRRLDSCCAFSGSQATFFVSVCAKRKCSS